MATAAATDGNTDDDNSPAIADTTDTEEPTIVDISVLEAAKENIQPLAAGRRVTALSSILSTPHAHREARLTQTKARLRMNVQLALENVDDDLLEAYCRFVYWTVENYPQGQSAESGLLELLEEATRVLKDHQQGRWRSDMRYLKLWVLYATYIERPAVIYRFCLANEIGTEYELLYEEFALSLERSSRRAEADKVYLLGIARKAQPLDRLKKKHEEFQKRMMVASAVPSQDAPAPSSSSGSSTSTTTARPALGTKSRPALTTRPAAEPPQDDVFSSNAATSRRGPANNARMQVFIDPTGAESESSTTNPFPDVGTRTSRVKENVPEVKKMGGTTLRQAGRSQRSAPGRSGATSSRIAVYRDPGPGADQEEEEGGMPPPPVPGEKEDKGKAAATSSSSNLTTKPRAFAVFCDADAKHEASTSASAPKTQSTPSFTPYRDEETASPAPPPSTSADGPAVIKVKKAAGARDAGPATEAEALRRDPFKNYDKTGDFPDLEGDDLVGVDGV